MMREDWIESQLGKVCFTTSGGTPSRRISTYYEGKIPWIKSGELKHNVIRESEEHISEDAVKNSSAKIFPEGTLLIALYGATIGKLAILGVPASTNQAVCGIYKNNLFDTKFLFNYLFHKKQKLIEQGAGGAQPNISQTILKKLQVPLAPLPEQRSIVAKIEKLFSDIDNGVTNLNAAKGKLEIYRQAVLKKAFEGGFTISGKWIQKRLRDIIKISSGYGLTKAERNDEGDYLVYGGNGVTGRHDKFMFDDKQLIIGRVGVHCGNSHITANKCWVTDNAFIVTFDKEIITLKCLYYLILSLRLNQYANSTAQPVISGGKVYPVEFLFPPKEIQDNLVQEIETRLSVCDNILATINEALEKSEALRQSVLKKAFEGRLLDEAELEACRKEADWEPADKLLERIKKEKDAKI